MGVVINTYVQEIRIGIHCVGHTSKFNGNTVSGLPKRTCILSLRTTLEKNKMLPLSLPLMVKEATSLRVGTTVSNF